MARTRGGRPCKRRRMEATCMLGWHGRVKRRAGGRGARVCVHGFAFEPALVSQHAPGPPSLAAGGGGAWGSAPRAPRHGPPCPRAVCVTHASRRQGGWVKSVQRAQWNASTPACLSVTYPLHRRQRRVQDGSRSQRRLGRGRRHQLAQALVAHQPALLPPKGHQLLRAHLPILIPILCLRPLSPRLVSFTSCSRALLLRLLARGIGRGGRDCQPEMSLHASPSSSSQHGRLRNAAAPGRHS